MSFSDFPNAAIATPIATPMSKPVTRCLELVLVCSQLLDSTIHSELVRRGINGKMLREIITEGRHGSIETLLSADHVALLRLYYKNGSLPQISRAVHNTSASATPGFFQLFLSAPTIAYTIAVICLFLLSNVVDLAFFFLDSVIHHGRMRDSTCWVTVFPDGSVYTGGLKEGCMHGEGTLVDTHGNYFVGEFENGMKKSGKILYANGDQYLGAYRDDKLHGSGTYFYVEGDVYVGEFVDDVQHGQGEVLTCLVSTLLLLV
jgi:hypothetical protein